MTSTWVQAYQRLLAKKRHLQALYDALLVASARAQADRADARADAQLWRNLLWLAPYSGRNGIRGDRLQHQPRIPTQRAALSPSRAPR